MVRLVLAVLMASALSACATRVPIAASDPPPVEVEAGWRDAAVADDVERLDGLAAIWARALAPAQRRAGGSLDAQGALLDPDAALDHPIATPGSYRCRLVRLGSHAGRTGLRAFPPFFCYVRAEAGNRLSFIKQTGSDLPAGWFYEDNDRRHVLLGARQKRVGETSLGYGDERERDLAGALERIDAFTWRLVVPARSDDALDIYELVPVPPEAQPEP